MVSLGRTLLWVLLVWTSTAAWADPGPGRIRLGVQYGLQMVENQAVRLWKVESPDQVTLKKTLTKTVNQYYTFENLAPGEYFVDLDQGPNMANLAQKPVTVRPGSDLVLGTFWQFWQFPAPRLSLSPDPQGKPRATLTFPKEALGQGFVSPSLRMVSPSSTMLFFTTERWGLTQKPSATTQDPLVPGATYEYGFLTTFSIELAGACFGTSPRRQFTLDAQGQITDDHEVNPPPAWNAPVAERYRWALAQRIAEPVPRGPVPHAPLVPVEGGSLEVPGTPYQNTAIPRARTLAVSSFSMATEPVTWEEWKAAGFTTSAQAAAVLEPKSSFPFAWFGGALAFCNAASLAEGLTPAYVRYQRRGLDPAEDADVDLAASGYRLPTTAEWIFAFRGGTKSTGKRFAGSDSLAAVVEPDGRKLTGPSLVVGRFAPNELGLYDLLGPSAPTWTFDNFGPITDGGPDPLGRAASVQYHHAHNAMGGVSYDSKTGKLAEATYAPLHPSLSQEYYTTGVVRLVRRP